MNRIQHDELLAICREGLEFLCGLSADEALGGRAVGSEGNRRATAWFRDTALAAGWRVESTRFDAVHWKGDAAWLQFDGRTVPVQPSPYSLGCDAEGILLPVSNIAELEAAVHAGASGPGEGTATDSGGAAAERSAGRPTDERAREGRPLAGRVLLLHGEIAAEQLMPRNFVFYNPPEHHRILDLLETGSPEAILCATTHNGALAGGVYPFPLIEDGDFDIPSLFMTEEAGNELLAQAAGRRIRAVSEASRIPGFGYQTTAALGPESPKIVISAHIDAKIGTPGAIDNGTGVMVLMLVMRLLAGFRGRAGIELVPFNGEDYFCTPGQLIYLRGSGENPVGNGAVRLVINIDGLGYHEGPTAISSFGLPSELASLTEEIIAAGEGITAGEQWIQGDHGMFVQQGIPALAVSSQWFIEHMETQCVTHTPADRLEIADCRKVVEAAAAVASLAERAASLP